MIYGWMRYFAEPEDEWAIVNHPWEPSLKALHIVLVPLLVFACGLVWRMHVWGRIRSGLPKRRRSGILLALLLVPMVCSGYLLQVSAAELWRTIWMWIHGISSCLWIVVYVWHQLIRRAD